MAPWIFDIKPHLQKSTVRTPYMPEKKDLTGNGLPSRILKNKWIYNTSNFQRRYIALYFNQMASLEF